MSTDAPTREGQGSASISWMKKFVKPGFVDEYWGDDEALQEMYVSLLGPEVWRNHRTLAAPTSMMLDLYMPKTWQPLQDGALATLAAALASGRFDGVEGMAAFIRNKVHDFQVPHQQMFAQHGCCFLGQDMSAFEAVLGADHEDPAVMTVMQLTAIMLTCMTADNDVWFVNYCAERIWYAICDVALVTPQPVLVTA